jgi:hypothetical protein
VGSGSVDFELAAYGCGDGPQVAGVRADHEVMAAEGSFNHARIHDVGGRGAGGERADRAGLAVIEGLDVASGQQPGQEGLAASAAPGLGHDGRGDCWYLAERQQGAVNRRCAPALPARGRDPVPLPSGHMQVAGADPGAAGTPRS